MLSIGDRDVWTLDIHSEVETDALEEKVVNIFKACVRYFLSNFYFFIK